jgi:cytochrome c biogenesis protein
MGMMSVKSGKKTAGGPLISQRTAVVTISILLGASAAGWLLTELLPPDLPYRREMFRQRWGDHVMRVIEALKLYDPFHSFWYSGILALFFAVLFLCIISRWRGFILRSFRPVPEPGDVSAAAGQPYFSIDWPELLEGGGDRRDPVSHFRKKYGAVQPPDEGTLERVTQTIHERLRRRGYSIRWRKEEGSAFFTATAGRWRFLGNFIFHAGLLVVTAGGFMGSRWGTTEILYGRKGDVIPIERAGFSLRIDDFRILVSSENTVSDYISELAVLGAGGELLASGEIEVNKPLRYGGFSIFQSSYYMDDEEFNWARLRIGPGKVTISVKPGEEYAVEGTPVRITCGRFHPDFRMGPKGPHSVSREMNNPALRIRVEDPEGVQEGWLFLFHPRFSTKFDALPSIALQDIEPVYYTGLQVSSNPGAPVLIAGMAMATAGLILLYSSSYRLLAGGVKAEGIIVVGRYARWRVSFEEELGRLEKDVRRLAGGGGG